jgi:hypothetical protein
MTSVPVEMKFFKLTLLKRAQTGRNFWALDLHGSPGGVSFKTGKSDLSICQ